MSRVARERPPCEPRLPTDRIKTPLSPACPCILILSPRSAPPEKGLDGSIATTPTFSPFLRRIFMMPSAKVDLPAPGGPVMPITDFSPTGKLESFLKAEGSLDSIPVINLAKLLTSIEGIKASTRFAVLLSYDYKTRRRWGDHSSETKTTALKQGQAQERRGLPLSADRKSG